MLAELTLPALEAPNALLAEALVGLARPQKRLPARLLYDHRGCLLLEELRQCPDYSQSQPELEIMRAEAARLAHSFGPQVALVELGLANESTRLLLEQLQEPRAYCPLDACEWLLKRASRELHESHPGLSVLPLVTDFTQPIKLPALQPTARRVVAHLPGSRLASHDPPEALLLLRRLRGLLGPGGSLLVGLDQRRSVEALANGYRDRKGVLAAFNLNALRHLNYRFQADFVLERFQHACRYNAALNRMELHLVSQAAQSVTVGGRSFALARGESIHTLNAYKFTPEQFARQAESAGFALRQRWSDARREFGMYRLSVV